MACSILSFRQTTYSLHKCICFPWKLLGQSTDWVALINLPQSWRLEVGNHGVGRATNPEVSAGLCSCLSLKLLALPSVPRQHVCAGSLTSASVPHMCLYVSMSSRGHLPFLGLSSSPYKDTSHVGFRGHTPYSSTLLIFLDYICKGPQ